MALGFPKATMTPLAAGGVPPYGEDMNGILAMLSLAARASEAGLLRPFSADFANAIGGYPRGATVAHPSAQGRFLICVTDGNTNDPGNSMAGWVDPLAGLLPASDPTVQGTLNVGSIAAPNNGSTNLNLLFGPNLKSLAAWQNDGTFALYSNGNPVFSASPDVVLVKGKPVAVASDVDAERERAQKAEAGLLPINNPTVQGTLNVGSIAAPNNGSTNLNLLFGPNLKSLAAWQNDGTFALYSNGNPVFSASPDAVLVKGNPVAVASDVAAERERAQNAEAGLLPINNPTVQGTLNVGSIAAPNNGSTNLNLLFGPNLKSLAAWQNDGTFALYSNGDPIFSASPDAVLVKGKPVATAPDVAAERERAQNAEAGLLPINNPTVQGTLNVGSIAAPNNGSTNLNLLFGPNLKSLAAWQNDGTFALYSNGSTMGMNPSTTFNGQLRGQISWGTHNWYPGGDGLILRDNGNALVDATKPTSVQRFTTQGSHGQKIPFPQQFKNDDVQVAVLSMDSGGNSFHTVDRFLTDRYGFGLSINSWNGTGYGVEQRQTVIDVLAFGEM